MNLSVVIQAGGKSSRMGEDKAIMPFVGGKTMVEYILDQVSGIGDEVIIIANDIEEYQAFNLPVYPDVYSDIGALGGIFSAIYHSIFGHCLILACDMPFVNLELIKYMIDLSSNYDVVIPRWKTEEFAEPFRAVYSKACLDPIKTAIESGQKRVISFFDEMNIRYVDSDEILRFDEKGLTFFNVNTPDELLKAREIAKSASL